MTVPKSTFSSRFKLRSLRKLRRHADRFKTLTENSDPSQCEVFFTGKSSYGPVGIAAGMSVESSASPDVGDALHALVLGVIEPKLQFAENWLQCGFDIEPGLKRPEVNSELLVQI